MTETKYDSSRTIEKHRYDVRALLSKVYSELYWRGNEHDYSKLKSPEKEIFDEYTPKLKELKFGSDEYKKALRDMGEGLKHHYKENKHHPEHFENGINDMTLIDIIEMVCDWVAASKENNNGEIDYEYLQSRFGISNQLINVIHNTVLLIST